MNARFRGRAVGADGRVLVDTIGTSLAHVSEAREYRECRVCGARRAVEASGRFPEHRISMTRCFGGGQFVSRWDAQRDQRLVAEVKGRWA